MKENYVLSATIELKDKFSAQVNKARSGFNNLSKSLMESGNAVNSAEANLKKVGASAMEAAAQAEKAGSSFRKLRGTYTANLNVKDNATSTARKVKTELQGLHGKVYTAVLNVKQNGNFSGKLDKMVSGAMMGLPVQAAGFAGIGYGVFDALSNYSDFTKQLSNLQAVTGLSGEEMDKVKEKALDLGAQTQYSSTEAALGMTELLKAGVDVKDVLGDASQAALDLASAGQLQLGEAAEIMSTAMNAFHMDDATHAADILAGAANASATSVGELKYSLAACASVAGGVGMSFDDTNTALAVFAQNGLKGSDAGTSLKTMLMNLTPQTSSAQKEFQRLGLLTEEGTSKFFDAEGRMKSLADIADILGESMAGMTDEEKMSSLNKLFGSDAIRGGMIMLREGAKGVRDMNKAMSNVTAHETAKVAMDNLNGSVLKLKSAWENLTIKLLDGGIGNGIRGFVDEISKLTSNFSGLLDDGFQVSDLLKILGEWFKDLKDKALAFDGVGSIFAGGALVFGLKKIYDLVKKTKSVFDDLTKTKAGGPSGSSAAKDMVIHANQVIVNGTISQGNGGATVAGGSTKGGKTTTGGSKSGSMLKRIPLLGGALTLGSGLLDIAYAPEGQRGAAAAGAAGGAAGWVGGAKLGAMAGGAVGSVIPGIGTAVGAGVGGLVGGFAGSALGQQAASGLASTDWSTFVESAKNGFGQVSELFAAKNQEWADAFEAFGEKVNSTIDGIGTFFSSSLEFLSQNISAKGQQWAQDFESFKENAGQALDGLGAWASGVWDDISQGASQLGSDIESAFSSAVDTVEGAWSGVVSWFDSNIWGPLKNAASSAWSEISSMASNISLPSAPSLPSFHFATGTLSAPGGWTEINERGGEIVDLPRGSRVYPHATTERMLQDEFQSQQSSAGPVVIKGNTFYVREEADIDRIAYKLAKLMQQGAMNYGGGY